MIEVALQWLGFSDQLIKDMGPTLTILLAVVAGGAFAQWIKFPLNRRIADKGLFSWTVCTLAMLATFLAAHFLSNSLAAAVEITVALLQPALYHITLDIIRRFWPWLETLKFVGAVDPPKRAYTSRAKRQAEKSGQDSGV